MSISPNVKRGCYFLDIEKDIGVTWAVCTYNQNEDEDYWMKDAPCSNSDKDCPFYLTREQAFDIVRKEVEKNVRDSEIH